MQRHLNNVLSLCACTYRNYGQTKEKAKVPTHHARFKVPRQGRTLHTRNQPTRVGPAVRAFLIYRNEPYAVAVSVLVGRDRLSDVYVACFWTHETPVPTRPANATRKPASSNEKCGEAELGYDDTHHWLLPLRFRCMETKIDVTMYTVYRTEQVVRLSSEFSTRLEIYVFFHRRYRTGWLFSIFMGDMLPQDFGSAASNHFWYK